MMVRALGYVMGVELSLLTVAFSVTDKYCAFMRQLFYADSRLRGLAISERVCRPVILRLDCKMGLAVNLYTMI